MQELGERIAALSASFEAEKEYQHDRWHKLSNDLTPVINLPERLTRETGRLHGIIDSKMSGLSRELEASIEAAVKKAVDPLSVRVKDLEEDTKVVKEDVEQLKIDCSKWSGARMFAAWLLSTIIAIAAAIGIHK